MTPADLYEASAESCPQALIRGSGILGEPGIWPLVPVGRVAVVASPSVPDARLRALLERLGPRTVLFPFSTRLLALEEIEDLARRLRREPPPDFLIGVGGGSVMDAVKAARHLGEGLGTAKLIAVPTTVGSGAEATPFVAYFVDGKKRSVEHPRIRPDGVVLDPALVAGLPAPIVRSSLLDAFCQAVESLWSLRATPRSRSEAARGLEIILEHGHAGVGGDTRALGFLQCAAHHVGRAIAESRTTLAHALSYELTAHWGVPHGEAVAIHLPLVVELIEEAMAHGALPSEQHEAMATLRRIFLMKEGSLAPVVSDFIRSVGAKARLAELGFLAATDAERLANSALGSSRAGNFPAPVEAGNLAARMRREILDARANASAPPRPERPFRHGS